MIQCTQLSCCNRAVRCCARMIRPWSSSTALSTRASPTVLPIAPARSSSDSTTKPASRALASKFERSFTISCRRPASSPSRADNCASSCERKASIACRLAANKASRFSCVSSSAVRSRDSSCNSVKRTACLRKRRRRGTLCQRLPRIAVEQRRGEVSGVLVRQVLRDLLVHLALKDLLGLPAVEVFRRSLRGAQRLEHLLVECPADEVLEFLADGELSLGGRFRPGGPLAVHVGQERGGGAGRRRRGGSDANRHGITP